VDEAKLERQDGGLVPQDGGWFVVNAKDTRWFDCGESGWYCGFEGREGARFPQLGININVLPPGGPMAMYHAEGDQEDFLVVSGEAVLIVEDEERPLRTWDFVHLPGGTPHVIVGAGDRPCVVVAVGARTPGHTLVYPVSKTALAHGAGVEQETTEPSEAYAKWPQPVAAAYKEGLLPEL
jgi:uncharacterized cupin superfamily protein